MSDPLRQMDWRFLLRRAEEPRILDLTDGGLSPGLAQVGRLVSGADGEADLAVLDFPSAAGLDAARNGLRPAGELACWWRAPRPAGLRRALARLERAGFVDVSFHRPGLGPEPEPALWLPLDAPTVLGSVLAERPPRSRRDALARRAWQLLGPVCALARLPDSEGTSEPLDELGSLGESGSWVLLTGGPESDAKVVGLPFTRSAEPPKVVVKFARTDRAEAALAREAAVLRELEQERPQLGGVPRLRAKGRRAGRLAIVQDAFHGEPLNATLSAATFAAQARRVTRWLIELAGEPRSQPASAWSERLLAAPLAELEADFAERLPADLPERARQALAELGDLPLVPEHRDFGPWNVILDASDEPAVIDWEDAEPQGLPGLDLIYFFASAGFAGEHLPDDVVTSCSENYRSALGITADDFQRLRLLCWIVQSLIALRRLALAETESTPAAADAKLFVRLAEEELQALEEKP